MKKAHDLKGIGGFVHTEEKNHECFCSILFISSFDMFCNKKTPQLTSGYFRGYFLPPLRFFPHGIFFLLCLYVINPSESSVDILQGLCLCGIITCYRLQRCFNRHYIYSIPTTVLKFIMRWGIRHITSNTHWARIGSSRRYSKAAQYA